MIAPETLRDRLARLAGFRTEDFVEQRGMYAVALGEDEHGTLVLVGATGRRCRASLAFPPGYQIDFGVNLFMDMQLLGVQDGEPSLVLTLPGLPDAGERLWPLRYFCANVDSTVIR